MACDVNGPHYIHAAAAPTTINCTFKGKGADGANNFCGYSNVKVDAIIEKLKTETDFAKRAELTKEALLLNQADVGHIPLHHQMIPWAMKKNVSVVHTADNALYAKWVVIK